MHNSKIFIIIIFLFVLSGCARLEWLDKKAGEIFFDGEKTNEIGTSTEHKGGGFSVAPPGAEDLTAEQKEKIEKWLTENNLNRYGDAMDIFYAGGTPLFDEVTGKSIERFEYILKKHPDIFEKIGE